MDLRTLEEIPAHKNNKNLAFSQQTPAQLWFEKHPRLEAKIENELGTVLC